MNSAAFVLVVVTFFPSIGGNVQHTTSPSVAMQEFKSEAACEKAKAFIQHQADRRRGDGGGSPFWRTGLSVEAICTPIE